MASSLSRAAAGPSEPLADSSSTSASPSSTNFNSVNDKQYSASASSPTSPLSSTSNAGPSPPGSPFYRTAKHVRVSQTSQSIKGTFRISPLAPDSGLYPPLYDLPQPDPKCSSSAEFVTKGSAVNVELLIGMGLENELDLPPWERGLRKSWHAHLHHHHHHGAANEGKEIGHTKANNSVASAKSSTEQERESLKGVWVNAKSHHGAVKVKIPQYLLPNPLSLRLKSHNGTITLVLPPSFSGVISYKSESGTLKLSPRIQARWKDLGMERHKHRGVGRVGAVTPDGMEVEEQEREKDGKRGDSAELISKLGHIYIEEVGEEKHENCCIA